MAQENNEKEQQKMTITSGTSAEGVLMTGGKGGYYTRQPYTILRWEDIEVPVLEARAFKVGREYTTANGQTTYRNYIEFSDERKVYGPVHSGEGKDKE